WSFVIGSTAPRPDPPQQEGSQQLALPPVLAATAAWPYFSFTTFLSSSSFMAAPFMSVRLTEMHAKGRSNSSGGRRLGAHAHPGGELRHAIADVVPDLAHPLEGLPLGILEGPILAPDLGDHRADGPTAHGDQVVHVGGHRRRDDLGLHVRQVDAQFLHHLDHLGVDPRPGLRPRGNPPGLRRVGDRIEEGRRHLGSAGIMDAGEEEGLHGSSWGDGGWSQPKAASARTAPRSWATTNPGTSTGRIPLNVSVKARARVTPG